jgi:hypothetical protein
MRITPMASSSYVAFDLGQMGAGDDQAMYLLQWPDTLQLTAGVTDMLTQQHGCLMFCCRYLNLLVEVSAVEQEVNKVG